MSADDPPPETDPGARSPADGTPVPVRIEADRRTRATWAALVGAPVAWLLHFGLVYLVAEAGCTGGGPGLRLLDPPVPVVVTLVATVVFVAIGVLVTLVGWRRWRDGEHLGAASVLLGALFTIAILFTAAPALVLGPC